MENLSECSKHSRHDLTCEWGSSRRETETAVQCPDHAWQTQGHKQRVWPRCCSTLQGRGHARLESTAKPDPGFGQGTMWSRSRPQEGGSGHAIFREKHGEILRLAVHIWRGREGNAQPLNPPRPGSTPGARQRQPPRTERLVRADECRRSSAARSIENTPTGDANRSMHRHVPSAAPLLLREKTKPASKHGPGFCRVHNPQRIQGPGVCSGSRGRGSAAGPGARGAWGLQWIQGLRGLGSAVGPGVWGPGVCSESRGPGAWGLQRIQGLRGLGSAVDPGVQGSGVCSGVG